MKNKTKQKSIKKLLCAFLFVSIVVSLFAATTMLSSAYYLYYDDDDEIIGEAYDGSSWFYVPSSYGTATLTFCASTERDEGGDIIVPSVIDSSYTVTGIAGLCFYDFACNSITLPETITTIYSGEFSPFDTLTIDKLYLPKSLDSIGDSTFVDCYISDVYYAGSREDWNEISIGSGNESLLVANFHYNYSYDYSYDYDYDYDNDYDYGHTHSYGSWKITKSATCGSDGSKKRTCSTCGYVQTESIPKTNKHSYTSKITKKATTSENGSIKKICKNCGAVKKQTIYKISSVSLYKTKYTYNGDTKKPTVYVYDSQFNKLKKDTDYTVKYQSGRKNIGKYKVTVTFKGKYSGTKNLYFTIGPKSTYINSTKYKDSKSITVSWKKASGASGYQIQYSNDPSCIYNNKQYDGSTFKSKTVSGNSKTSISLSGLTRNKVWYIRIRTYKKISDTKYYSTWSNVKAYINMTLGYERYVYPSWFYNMKSWSSKNESVVACLKDDDGYRSIKAKGLGNTTVTLKTKSGSKTTFCTVYVTTDEIYVYKGTTASLPKKLNGEKTIKWTSNGNKKIATVKDNKVKGVKAGVTNLTYKSSGVTYKARICVVDYDKLYKRAYNHLYDSLIVPESLKIYHVWRGFDKDGYPVILLDFGAKASDGSTRVRKYFKETSWYNSDNKLKYNWKTTEDKPSIKNSKKIK